MRIGIDLGGTKIEVIALDSAGIEIHRQRIATPQGDYLKTVYAICDLVQQTEQRCQTQAKSIGIGIPGAISPATGLIKNANSTCLIGQRLDRDLETILQRKITLANDADCFALSEATDGSGADYNSVFGVILGTGVGAGIVINKGLLAGPNAICGEWGHNPLPWITENDAPGRACYCGKEDCIETFLSGPGFASAFAHIAQTSPALTPIQIWKSAEQGDTLAIEHCERYLEQLAKALASVINILDPEVIVLGGGLSNVENIYAQIPTRLEKYVFSDSVYTHIKKAKYGDSSGVRGAAWL